MSALEQQEGVRGYGLTTAERADLPPEYHKPFFDGLGEPNSWLCAVCWGDGWATPWPCPVVATGEAGAALARSLGLGWSR